MPCCIMIHGTLHFYATHDPLDNAVPSLHVAIPFGILMLVIHCMLNQKAIRSRRWRHYRYLHVYSHQHNHVHFCNSLPRHSLNSSLSISRRIRRCGIRCIVHSSFYSETSKRLWFHVRGVDREKVRKHVWSRPSSHPFAAIMGAVNHQSSTSEKNNHRSNLVLEKQFKI